MTADWLAVHAFREWERTCWTDRQWLSVMTLWLYVTRPMRKVLQLINQSISQLLFTHSLPLQQVHLLQTSSFCEFLFLFFFSFLFPFWAMSLLYYKVESEVNFYGKSSRICTGWPNKNGTFLRCHIFAAATDIIMRFLLKCREITAENNKRHFFLNVH